MVWPNPFERRKGSTAIELGDRATDLARAQTAEWFVDPKTRLAAVIADSVLIIPLFSILVAPFKKQIQSGLLFEGASPDPVSILKALLLCFTVGVFLHTLLVALYGTTPGKFVLGLRIVSRLSGAKPKLMQAFLRAFFWWSSLVLLGAPFFAVSRHSKRRCWYDRIADTDVVSKVQQAIAKNNSEASTKALFALRKLHLPIAAIPVGPPQSSESNQAALMQMSLYASAFLILIHLSFQTLPELYREKQVAELNASPEQVARECQVVDYGLSSLSAHLIAIKSDLDSLKKAGSAALPQSQIPLDVVERVECLGKLVDFHLWTDDDGPVAHFAKGLKLQIANSDGSERYLGRVCQLEPDGSECKWLQAKRSDLRELSLQFEKDQLPTWLGVALLADYRSQLFDSGRAALAAGQILQLSALHPLGPAELSYWVFRVRLEALRLLNRFDEIRTEVEMARRLSPAHESAKSVAWLCGHPSQPMECGARNLFCSLNTLETSYGDLKATSDAELALIGAVRTIQCQAQSKDPSRVERDLLRLKDRAQTASHAQFVEALMKEAKAQRSRPQVVSTKNQARDPGSIDSDLHVGASESDEDSVRGLSTVLWNEYSRWRGSRPKGTK